MDIKSGDWNKKNNVGETITKKHFRPVEAQAYKVN